MDLLEKYAQNLNSFLKLNPKSIFGRDKEIQIMIEYLMLKNKSNPLLIGEAGVGKTALVEGLVNKIISGDIPDLLKNTTIFSLETSALMSKEESPEFILRSILEEMKGTDSILFIDEIHTIMNSQSNEISINLGNTLKPALARGEIKVIGATTIEEYHQYLTKDRALTRRFNKITVKEFSKNQTITLLNQLKQTYEKHYTITISEKSITQCCDYADRYIHNNQFPDKALDILDEASSITYYSKGTELGEKEIQQAIYQRTNIPPEKFDTKEAIEKLLSIKNVLQKHVKGQDNAIELVSKQIIQAQAGLSKTNKPVASFLFLGTTGVGKTELAKQLKYFLFLNNPKGLFRFDMSEYSDPKNAVSKLIGDATQDGTLIKSIQENPYCILLFDEIEKAEKNVFNVFLQLLDEGRLTDRYGREVTFRHAIVIFTTNLGAELIIDKSEFGAMAIHDESKERNFKKQINNELENIFKPELLNRIDQKIIFNVLNTQAIKDIIRLKLKTLEKKLEKEKITLVYDETKLFPYLIRVGYDKFNGARPIERTITEQIQFPLAELILKNRINNFTLESIMITTKGTPPTKTDRYGSEKILFKGKTKEL